MELKENSQDPRKIFGDKLVEAGVDAQKANWIALDVGTGAVDREYLMRWGLKGKQLKNAECLIMDFHLGRLM